MKNTTNRRGVLRGMLGGSAVTVGVPLLDLFLDGNGKAFAGTAAPLPVRFGTWFWGCGVNSARWFPKATGKNYDIPPEIQPISAHQDSVSVLSGFDVYLEGRTNFCHHTGQYAIRTGFPPPARDRIDGHTFDTTIAEQIGSGSRFRSLDLTCTGDARDSYSRPTPDVVNPAEASPVAFYKRLFGSEFQDPNAAAFTPDPNIMVRHSVLSAVKENYGRFSQKLGAADKERMDQYMTSIRQLEQQLALQLQKPAPAVACVVPKGAPDEMKPQSDMDTSLKNHALFADLLAMALACNQTRVFNMVFSSSFSTLRQPGTSVTHHQLTHEEPIDTQLGYQPKVSVFVAKSMVAWGLFLDKLAGLKEGDGTLLDQCMILAHSDTTTAKLHSINSLPIMIAGKAGGKLRSGLHVAGGGQPVTRVTLTLQQLMGVAVDQYGYGSMQTSKPVPELLV